MEVFWNTAKQLSTSKPIYKITILLPSNEVTCTIIFTLFYSYIRKYLIPSSFYTYMEISLTTMGISHSQGETYQLSRKNLGKFLMLPFFPVCICSFERIWKQFAGLSRWAKIKNKYGSLAFLKIKAQVHTVL